MDRKGKIIASGLFGGALALGTWGIIPYIFRERAPLPQPVREDYNFGEAPIMASYLARDLDLDGNADTITGSGYGIIKAFWIAEGEEELIKNKGISFDTSGEGTTMRMTPKMRTGVSQLIASHNEVNYEMAKSRHAVRQAKRTGQ